jgi:hypothetical protein
MTEKHSYAMLATLDGPVLTQLSTTFSILGTTHSQIIHIQINPQTFSIMKRKYRQLFEAPGTQAVAPYITLHKNNYSEGLTGRILDTCYER